uniref:receptor-like protein EIX2 n=1 Tax=Erigeron canadensis TaxID=72917 RepID=UPI001CB90A50|nr:receptor-like protein EIX2 [Erigeron canadensis]
MVTKRFGDDVASHRYPYAVRSVRRRGTLEGHPHLTLEMLEGDNYRPMPPLETVIEAVGEALFTDIAFVAWKGKVREFGRSNLELLKSIDLSNNSFSGILPNEITRLVEVVSLNFSCNKFHGQVPEDIGQLKYLETFDLSGNEFSGSIPSSLSLIDSLGYLDLSNNNLSGKIPLGNGRKLQQFNSSSYNGNHLLCGPPLTQECGFMPVGPVDGKQEDDQEEEEELWKSYYMGMGVGFGAGFWGICGAIFLNRRCRYVMFASLSHVKDWIYISLVVYLRKLKR